MMRKTDRILTAAMAAFAFMLLLFAPMQRAFAAGEIETVEAWFNSTTTLEADFTQISSAGNNAKGKFFFKRPFFSRFEFDEGTPLILITTETWLHVDETDRRQVTSYPVSETPLASILNDPVRLTGDNFTTKAEVINGVIRITLDNLDGLAAGQLILDYSQAHNVLYAWHVIDPNGIVTSVRLDNIRIGAPISQRLFVPANYDQ